MRSRENHLPGWFLAFADTHPPVLKAAFPFVARDLLLAEGSWKPGFGVIHGGERGLVWNGHIHSYERTWPIDQDKPVEKNGTIHLITGGGGGHLETPGPFRTPFTQIVRRGHHYAMVWVNGSTLVYKAYDLEGRLFDTFELKK